MEYKSDWAMITLIVLMMCLGLCVMASAACAAAWAAFGYPSISLAGDLLDLAGLVAMAVTATLFAATMFGQSNDPNRR